jgi:hypothetical protein
VFVSHARGHGRADPAFVERVTHVTYETRELEWSTPDGCWDLVVLKKRGQTLVLHTGLISKPVRLENEPGDSFLAISFKPGVFLPSAPGSTMLDRGVLRPLPTVRTFALENDRFEVPSFESAEQLVTRLADRGLLARDELVESVAAGEPRAATPRSLQRHFLAALGMTPKKFSQIKRASAAVDLLRRGLSPAEVALEAGYSDQPHLTRSLKAIMGQTPGELVRGVCRFSSRA